MAKFIFRLDAVLRLRQEERARRRQELAEAILAQQVLEAEERRIRAEKLQLQAMLTRHAAPGTVSVDALLEARRYELLLAAQEKYLTEQQARLRAEIDRRRDALARADAAVKLLEKLRQRRQTEFTRQQLRREARLYEEQLALRAYYGASHSGFSTEEAPTFIGDEASSGTD
jgi:flagellar FliJ protein